VWICIPLYLVALNSLISSLESFGSRWFGNFRLTNSGQIHLNLSHSSFTLTSKNLKSVGSRQTL